MKSPGCRARVYVCMFHAFTSTSVYLCLQCIGFTLVIWHLWKWILARSVLILMYYYMVARSLSLSLALSLAVCTVAVVVVVVVVVTVLYMLAFSLTRSKPELGWKWVRAWDRGGCHGIIDEHVPFIVQSALELCSVGWKCLCVIHTNKFFSPSLNSVFIVWAKQEKSLKIRLHGSEKQFSRTMKNIILCVNFASEFEAFSCLVRWILIKNKIFFYCKFWMLNGKFF